MIKRIDYSDEAQQADTQQLENDRCAASVMLVTGQAIHYAQAIAAAEPQARACLARDLKRVGVPTCDIAYEPFQPSEDRPWDAHGENF